MFDFWSLAGDILRGGVSAFLGNSGNSKSSGYTDNSNFTTNNQSKPIPKAGKVNAANVVEGFTPGYNQGGATDKGFNPNFDWKGSPFNTTLKNFLDKDDKEDNY